MPRATTASDKELWGQALSLLLLGFICYAFPWSVLAAEVAPSLRIQGSNTIGAKLGPALVRGMLEEEGIRGIRQVPGERENEVHIEGQDAQGRAVRIELAAHGSSTGFSALGDGSADLAASSRPIKDAEAQALSAFGDLRSPYSEQVIAIDGLAIILHPGNPLRALSTAQLAAVFAGEVSTWEELGSQGGAIRLYARDDQSGTYDTFKELVLARQGKSLAAGAQRFESSDRLSAAVSADPQGIGFVGLASIGQARALAIVDGESQPMAPSTDLIATEDYPLSRRLYLYMKPGEQNPWADALLRFAQSPPGQAIVERSGFIAQQVGAVRMAPRADMPEDYRTLATEAERLSVNFRFQEGSASLDNKALRDVQRLVDYLKQRGKLQRKVVLVGFGDAKADPQRAELLSRLRAMAVRRELAKGGVALKDVKGFGDVLPVAANSAEDGRNRNRRVEVWVY
ncbi:substrate-binding domain-containing protein [Metapseudomonas furukawaii]|uniref:Phosphate-binding protein n=1 Tax=Metapseudomonas furukawaii TaxID=1149133 RepID=A0AAD1FG98_METFU|nr:phosphate ABC transporter substrate-binding/OmpA family protein [Pseudomonas furukawaii]ELS24998.1 putative ABC-type periplasmic phosphate-binding protein [Pseudomonas furukawaii]BAU74218.1 phosphate-binding protein [Pseudomonas furukawaii]